MGHQRCASTDTDRDTRPSDRLRLHQVFDARLNERERKLLALLDGDVARLRRDAAEPDAH